MEMMMAITKSEMEDTVGAFVAIVNRSQTRQLREWNGESLRRALRWAAIVEAAASHGDQQLQEEEEEAEDARFRQRFPLATLPTLAPDALLRRSDLRRATQHLLGAILQSPFLASHPIRSELMGLVLAEVRVQRQLDPESPLVSAATISRLLAKTTIETQRSRTTEAIALAVSKSFKPVNVPVMSWQVTIPPVESYLLHPRTVKLYRIAATLQQNAVNARAASDQKHYDSFLHSVQSQLIQDTSNDIAEVLALLVTRCKWPPTSDALRVDDPAADVVQILIEWVREKLARCMAFPPWLAATLAAKYDAVAAIYVPYLLHSGFLEPEHAFAHRVAALVVQSERLSAAVNHGLAQLDPLVLAKLLLYRDI